MNQQQPEFGKLFGITHDVNTGLAIAQRPPRVLKIGIGASKGPAVNVFIHKDIWHVRGGVFENGSLSMKTLFQGGAVIDKKVTPNTREAAEAFYNKHKASFAVSNRPQQVPYFTFTHKVLSMVGGKPVEQFEPDFEMIEAHGNLPQRIPVILASSTPLTQKYNWWSASELKCHGDGLVALRVLGEGSNRNPNWQEAKDAGLPMFSHTPCASQGCPQYLSLCKPSTSIDLQLANALRLGVTAYFTSSGVVTASTLSTSLAIIKSYLEDRGFQITGIPMDLVRDTFPARKGKSSLQPFVYLELRAAGLKALRELVGENTAPLMLKDSMKALAMATADTDVVYELQPDVGEEIDPYVSEPEYAPDDDFEAPTAPPAANATRQKQNDASQKLKSLRERRVPWATAEGMNALLATAQGRVGDAAFRAACQRHGVDSSLQYDDPKAVVFYMDLKALPDLVTDAAPPEPEPEPEPEQEPPGNLF